MTEKSQRDSGELPANEMISLEDRLNAFSAFVERQSSKDERILTDPWAWRFNGGESDFHILVTVMIHGDEVGPLDGLLDVMDALESGKMSYCGVITCVIGNPEAGRLNKRFVDLDLNRVFERKDWSAQEGERSPLEISRAEQIMSYIDDCDLFIDFHQTILDSEQSFYITPWSLDTWRWMRLMGGARVWVTRHPEQGGGGIKCADEYARLQSKPAIALELGALGFTPKARAGVWKSLSRAIKAINSIHRGEVTLTELADGEKDLIFFETKDRVQFDDPRMCLREGIINFEVVNKGQRLSPDDEQSPEIFASQSGVILFPKYPPRDEKGLAIDPRPSEIYRIISPLSGHPLELWEPSSSQS